VVRRDCAFVAGQLKRDFRQMGKSFRTALDHTFRRGSSTVVDGGGR